MQATSWFQHARQEQWRPWRRFAAQSQELAAAGFLILRDVPLSWDLGTLEVSCGCAALTAALREKKGFRATALDWRGDRHATRESYLR